MAVFKCKMCGAALNLQGEEKIIQCEFCGTQQTLPRLDDEARENLYDRANHFRRNNDYDKATAIYEQILNEDTTDAEAYWSIVLCRYGIEYVEDPATRKRVPTINRMQYTSILADEDYKSALQHADISQRKLYESEAKAIDKIQKGILAISQAEEPFDVFICYKETDNNGRRTPDSVLAQELYYGLKDEGFKVFFARITLEDKLGSAYEPYIFAALNSAKAMVVLGTKPEHFNAVWVKNEWSRYLSLIKKGEKKTLIPAYKGVDPYDLPEEFSHLQAQDMSKLGFMQDLIRGIKKIVNASKKKETPQVVVQTQAATGAVSALVTRMQMSIEDGEFEQVDKFAEQILNQDPTNAQVYLCKLMAEYKVKNKEDLGRFGDTLEHSTNYARLLRFGDKAVIEEIKGYIEERKTQVKLQEKAEAYAQALKKMSTKKAAAVQEAKRIFDSLGNYSDSMEKSRACDEIIEFIIPKQKKRRKKILLVSGIAALIIALSVGVSIPVGITMKNNAERKASEQQAEAERIASEQQAEAERIQAEAERIARAEKEAKVEVLVSEGKYAEAYALLEELGRAEEQLSWAYKAMADGDVQKACDLGLTDIVIPAGTTEIADEQFQNFTALTSVVIPDSVTSIGWRAFSGCSSLTEINIPDSVTSIEDWAFSRCSSLTSVVIGESVTSIGSEAFQYCSSLTEIVVDINNTGYQSLDGNLYSKDGKMLIQYAIGKAATSFTIPDSVTYIGAAFSGCSSLTEINIPDSVTSIGDEAFYRCSSLTEINIPDSVTSIGWSAFLGCSSLTSVVIPNSVTSIGDNAFSGCSSLTSVVIPDSVTRIGVWAFSYCSSLTSITFEGTIAQWNAISKDGSWNDNVPAMKVVCKDGTVAI